MRSEFDLETAIDKYSDTVKRICYMYLKNSYDTEDIFQNVFFKYALSDKDFESAEYEKAWIIRVTINACKDLSRNYFRKNTVPLESAELIPAEEKDNLEYVRSAVLKLPKKYKDVVYLYYFEGYNAFEIAGITGISENTVYTRLARARKILKEKLGGDFDE